MQQDVRGTSTQLSGNRLYFYSAWQANDLLWVDTNLFVNIIVAEVT